MDNENKEFEAKDGVETPDGVVNADEQADPAAEGADAVAAPDAEKEEGEGEEIGGDEAVA